MDVGGNAVGARVIAQYRQYFQAGDYDMFCVINRYREDTADLDGVLEQLRSIEATIGAPVTGLINNTHLLRDTSVADVLYGQELVEAAAAQTGLPVRYISVLERLADQLPPGLQGEVFP